MKSDRKYLNSVIVTIVIAAMGQQIAQAQNAVLVAPASARTTAAVLRDSLGLSDQRNWQSFLKLAAKPNAIVTDKDLESAFEQKAVHQEQAGSYNFYRIQDIVTLDSNGDRFARARYPNRTSNFISFHFFDGRNAETCITRYRAISDLQRAGWVLRIHSPAVSIQGDIREVMPPDMGYASYTFIKGDQGIAILGYLEKTNCAVKLTMESDKLEFDRITHTNTSENGQ